MAERAFAERGYDGVTVAELTSAMGIRPPSFYAAFGSKAALFERVAGRYAGGEGAALAAELTGEDAGDALRRLLARAATLYAESGQGCLVTEAARGTREAAAVAACDAISARTRDGIAGYLRSQHVAGPERVADLVMVALTGLSGAARRGASAEVLAGFAEVAGEGLTRRVRSG